MKALLKSYNLMGDGLVATPSIKAFYKHYQAQFPDLSITLATDPGPVSVIYQRVGVPLELLTCPREEVDDRGFDFVFEFNISRAWQIGTCSNVPSALAHAAMLGVALESISPVYQVPEEILGPAPSELILFQPYSVSCSSHSGQPANKRWQDEKWVQIYQWLRRDFPDIGLRVLGSAKDQTVPGLPEEDHCFGLHLDAVAALQNKARLVLTLDSGVAHLAASQDARIVELYPECLPSRWMSHLECSRYRMIHARPWDVSPELVYNLVYEQMTEKA